MFEASARGAGDFVVFLVFLIAAGAVVIGGPVLAFVLARASLREAAPAPQVGHGSGPSLTGDDA